MNEENLKRLKSWMSENKHSQQEIADRMGVSQAYVNQLLNGLSKFGKRTALRGMSSGLIPSGYFTKKNRCSPTRRKTPNI